MDLYTHIDKPIEPTINLGQDLVKRTPSGDGVEAYGNIAKPWLCPGVLVNIDLGILDQW